MKPDRRKDAARAIVRYGPDLDVLVGRLSDDERMERMPLRARIPIRAMNGYLTLRSEVVPDWVPLVGRFDDAVHSALVLRFVLRGTNDEMLREAWPGPDAGLNVLLAAIGVAGAAPRPRLPFLK